VPDTEWELRKITPLLEKGARQLAASPLKSGVLLLDIGRDYPLRNYRDELQALLEEAPWAASISALVLLRCLGDELREEFDVVARRGHEAEFGWLGECLEGSISGS
jgi:hypothetical protein